MNGRFRHFLAVAVRLAWSADASQRWRQVSVVSAAALLAVAIGTGVALVSAAAAADQRDLVRRMVYAGNDPAPPLWVSVRGEIWNGRQFPVTWLYGDSDAPLPPGLAELPPPGTMVASPAIANRPNVVASLGLTLAPAGTGAGGAIGPEGLLADSEWFVYASPPEGRTLGAGGSLLPVSGFGVNRAEAGMPVDTDRAAPTRNAMLVSIWPLLLVPALLIAWTCSRARSDVRRSRTRTLYRLGFGPGELLVFTAVETASLAVPASLLGALFGTVVLPQVQALPMTGLVLNAGALEQPAWRWIAAALFAALAMVVLGGSSRSVTTEAASTQGVLAGEPSRLRVVPLMVGLAVMLVSKGISSSAGMVMLVVGMLITVVALPLALLVLIRIAGLLISRSRPPALWLAGHRMARSAQRHAGPAVVLGLLVFVVGGGTGVLMSNEARAEAQSAPSSAPEILRLNWRDPRPDDLQTITESLPSAVVLPVADDTVYVDSCADMARFTSREASRCDTAGLSATLAGLTGLTAEIGLPPGDITISEVLIGGDPSVTKTAVWRIVNSRLPAVNLFNVGMEPIKPPLVISWVLGGLLAAAGLLTVAAAHTFGNRLLALGQEDQYLVRIGLDGDQTRAVQRWTAMAPLVPAIALGFCGAVLFSWAGSFREFTRLPLLMITVEAAAVALVAAIVAVGVGLVQRRQGGRAPG